MSQVHTPKKEMKTHNTSQHPELIELRDNIASQLGKQGVVILPPMDIELSSRLLLALGFHAQCCVLDPWYNKGVGGVREDYDEYLPQLLQYVAPLSDHVFLWGLPRDRRPVCSDTARAINAEVLVDVVLQELAIAYTRLEVRTDDVSTSYDSRSRDAR